MTNNGPFHQELEEALCKHLGVQYISLFSNATIALITALRALGVTGEAITTPYSFVATAHSMLWNGVEPVFVDVDPVTLNIDTRRIEEAITPRTTAIIAVHVYGTPCDVEAIENIARKHKLKVIYDAAHAFGVRCHCGSLLNHGDLSVLSFHATKVFNTFEGGAIVSKDKNTKQFIDQLKNFGFTNETAVDQTGINGKMSEFNAAIGLLQLKHIKQNIERRARIDAYYRAGLEQIPGIRCHVQRVAGVGNYGYFPIFVGSEYPMARDDLYLKMKNNGIHARRYFYPLITEFPMYRNFPTANRDNLTNAALASEQVLCLPIYPDLTEGDVTKIINQIAFLKNDF